jgi:hypothetical protein
MNKRAVTPLLATFILVGFAVSLGALVMQFGSGLETPVVGCGSDIQLDVSSCINEEGIQINIKNIGSTSISGVEVIAYGKELGVLLKKLEEINPSETVADVLPYTEKSFGTPESIEFTPYYGKSLCEQNIIRPDISDCK